MAQYQTFWLNPQDVSPAWLALLLFTITLGAGIVSESLKDGSARAQAERLSRLGTHALVLAGPTRPQPFLVEALALYSVCRLFRLHNADFHTWQILGQTMRFCYQAGYHRDPSQNPRISDFDGDMRRRVWMVVCELEVSVSHVLGFFSWRDPRVCDTEVPSNLDDTDFSPHNMGQARAPETCTLIQVAICYARLVQVLGEITNLYHAIQAPSRKGHHILEERLNDARDSLAETLKMKPLEQSLIDPPTRIADRLRLEFVYLTSLCVLYRRFMEDESLSVERERCVDVELTIIDYSSSMLHLTQPGCQLALLKITFMRHVHDFNFAAMLLCRELQRHGDQMSAERNSTTQHGKLFGIRDKLLEVCHLWSMPGFASPKARLALNAMINYLQGMRLSPSPLEARDSVDTSIGQPTSDTAGLESQGTFSLFPSHPDAFIGSVAGFEQDYFDRPARDTTFLPGSAPPDTEAERDGWLWTYGMDAPESMGVNTS